MVFANFEREYQLTNYLINMQFAFTGFCVVNSISQQLKRRFTLLRRMKPALSISSLSYIISIGTEDITSTCTSNYVASVCATSLVKYLRSDSFSGTHHKPAVYVSVSDSCAIHDEQALFVIEASVEIQDDVCDENQIDHPIYYLHHERRHDVTLSCHTQKT